MINLYIKNSKGEHSLTATLIVIGFIVACAKLLLSGVVIGSINCGTFTGLEFAAVVGSLGVIYNWRQIDADKNSNTK